MNKLVENSTEHIRRAETGIKMRAERGSGTFNLQWLKLGSQGRYIDVAGELELPARSSDQGRAVQGTAMQKL